MNGDEGALVRDWREEGSDELHGFTAKLTKVLCWSECVGSGGSAVEQSSPELGRGWRWSMPVMGLGRAFYRPEERDKQERRPGNKFDRRKGRIGDGAGFSMGGR